MIECLTVSSSLLVNVPGADHAPMLAPQMNKNHRSRLSKKLSQRVRTSRSFRKHSGPRLKPKKEPSSDSVPTLEFNRTIIWKADLPQQKGFRADIIPIQMNLLEPCPTFRSEIPTPRTFRYIPARHLTLSFLETVPRLQTQSTFCGPLRP